MTKIVAVKNEYKRPFLNPRNTGIAAGVALTLTAVRGFSKNKSVVKSHRVLGVVSAALTLLHIGTIEYLHHKYKKM